MSERRVVRAALTQTRNAFGDMPARPDDLPALEPRLDEVRAANVEHHLALMRRARGAGAQLICFGELFAGPYFALETRPLWLGLAEDPYEGPTAQAMRAAARELSMIVVAPIYERCPESGKRFNTAVVIDERGEVLGLYRKTHIPNGRNEQGAFSEGFYYERGDGAQRRGPADVSQNPFFPVFQTSVGRVAVAICYDRHFPGVLATLAAEGAEVVLCPAVTFGAKSRRMWDLEFPVDACRHRVFVGGSNRSGKEPPWNQPYFGSSYFCGPNGPCPDLCADDPELVVADLDLAELAGADPSGWDLPRDTRDAIYSWGRRPPPGTP